MSSLIVKLFSVRITLRLTYINVPLIPLQFYYPYVRIPYSSSPRTYTVSTKIIYGTIRKLYFYPSLGKSLRSLRGFIISGAEETYVESPMIPTGERFPRPFRIHTFPISQRNRGLGIVNNKYQSIMEHKLKYNKWRLWTIWNVSRIATIAVIMSSFFLNSFWFFFLFEKRKTRGVFKGIASKAKQSKTKQSGGGIAYLLPFEPVIPWFSFCRYGHYLSTNWHHPKLRKWIRKKMMMAETANIFNDETYNEDEGSGSAQSFINNTEIAVRVASSPTRRLFRCFMVLPIFYSLHFLWTVPVVRVGGRCLDARQKKMMTGTHTHVFHILYMQESVYIFYDSRVCSIVS